MWRKPTKEDLEKSLSATEVAAYSRAAKGTADPEEIVADVLTRTVDTARGYIRSNPKLTLSPDAGLVPEGLIAPIMDIAAYDLIKRLPVTISETRTSARNEALRLLRDVASGAYFCESFGQPESAKSGAAVASSSPPRIFTQESQRRL